MVLICVPFRANLAVEHFLSIVVLRHYTPILLVTLEERYAIVAKNRTDSTQRSMMNPS